MIEFIKNWAEGIIIAVIIATILEMLLPDNKNKKYISTVIGFFILFSIISPIFSKFTGKNININDYIGSEASISTNYTISNINSLENNSNVEDIYIKTLKSDITNTINNLEYDVNNINLKIETNTNKNYGEILGLYLYVSKRDNTINNINTIKIDINSNKNYSKSNNLSEAETQNLKAVLTNTYGIDVNKIYINKE